MATSGVNVLRYSALFSGAIYGIYHQSSLSARAKQNEVHRKYAREESLIQEAKAEYVKRRSPKDKTAGGNAVMDPDDPKFNLEAFLMAKFGDEAK